VNVLLLQAWLREEGPALVGARLRGGRQLDAKSIALDFATEQGRTSLLVSVREDCPTLARLGEAAAAPDRADEPAESGFVKALKYQLGGHTLIGIQQDGFERSVTFRFHYRDQYGRDTLKLIVVELAGRASNAYLVSERGMVVSILKRIPPGSNRVRHVKTGKPLPPPPPLGKFVASEQDEAALEAELATLAAEAANAAAQAAPLRELLTRRIAGGEVKLWPALEPLLPVEHGLDALYAFVRELQAGELTARLFDLHEPGDANRTALKAWQTATRSAAPATKETRPAADAAAGIRAQLALAARADELEQLGLELLSAAALDTEASLAQTRLAAWQAEHADWAERIDPLASVADNAQRLVNFAQRLRRGRETLERKLAETSDPRAARAPRGAMSEQSAPPVRGANESSAKLERRGVKHLRFTSSDGMTILCGQSDASNDGLLRQFGNARHLWLHARDFPGSHVILMSSGADVPRRTLEEAATIAAYYSKGQKNHEVEVSYVPMKHVRKPKGAKPGLVHISHEKVVSVRPARFEEWRAHLLRAGAG
jgi:predicted ribosome quality control (RQC) complex YloA/Tae2 family protein